MFFAGMVLLMTAMAAALASIVIRFRRASVQSASSSSSVFAAVILLPTWIVAIPFYSDSCCSGLGGRRLPRPWSSRSRSPRVLRYRLYDIDLVISRTLLVAGLAGFITVTYVAIVVGIGSLVGRGDEPNLVLSVAATAFVAVAFQPVRRWLRRVANRWCSAGGRRRTTC